MVSRDCCVALPSDVMGFLQFVVVEFTDHTHYFLIFGQRTYRCNIFCEFNLTKCCRLLS